MKIHIYIFLLISIVGGTLLGAILSSIKYQKKTNVLIAYQPNLPTRIYDIKKRIIAELFLHKRQLIKLSDIPQHIIDIFLAVEDTNFYQHIGIDFKGITRALLKNLTQLEFTQGGSTFTQQLAKRLFTKGEKSLTRKIKEAIYAIEIEKHFSKNEILEMYLNQIYLGHGSYGLHAAANFYFNKPVQELNIMEGVILASLPKAPHRYSPYRSPHRSIEKSKLILKRLAHLNYIPSHAVEKIHTDFWVSFWPKVMKTPPTLNYFGIKNNRAPYFVEMIRQKLEKKFSKEKLYSQGYQIYTTLDLDLQKFSEEALNKAILKGDPIAKRSNLNLKNTNVSSLSLYNMLSSIIPLASIKKTYSLKHHWREQYSKKLLESVELFTLTNLGSLNNISNNFIQKNRIETGDLDVQGAFISMNPTNGRIYSMVGGREFSSSDQFNRALLARRQPGSVFKPFVYGAALEDRVIHSNMGLMDAPLLNLEEDGNLWAPTNYGGNYTGYVTLTRALASSMNLVSIQVYEKTSDDKIVDFASRLMGIQNPNKRFQKNPSLALGSSEVTPLELLLGYSIIANHGKKIEPHSIIYIANSSGYIIDEPEKQIMKHLNTLQKNNQIQVIEEGVAFILRKMMKSVLYGTAYTGIRVQGGYHGDGAGKTGTTSGWKDAWFAGFTTDLAAVVWLGLDKSSLTLGTHQAGGAIATPIWGEFMKRTYKLRGHLPKPFAQSIPKGIKSIGVTKVSGKLPNKNCKEALIRSYVPEGILVDGKMKYVPLEKSDCSDYKTENFLELLQKQNNLSNEEIGKTRKIQSQY